MPMRGKSDETVQNELKEVEAFLSSHLGDIEVINYFEDAKENIAQGGDATALHYLSRSIGAMRDANLVVFVEGWETARGCRIERQVAEEYDRLIVDVPQPITF